MLRPTIARRWRRYAAKARRGPSSGRLGAKCRSGGAVHTIFHPGIQGSQAPMVDANFANDPEAAHIVLRSGAGITLVGMDVTMTTLFQVKRRKKSRGTATRRRRR
jgi:hypothetical protein